MNHNPVVIAPSRFLDRLEFNSLKSAFFDILFGAKCGPEKGRWGERWGLEREWLNHHHAQGHPAGPQNPWRTRLRSEGRTTQSPQRPFSGPQPSQERMSIGLWSRGRDEGRGESRVGESRDHGGLSSPSEAGWIEKSSLIPESIETREIEWWIRPVGEW